MKEQELKRELEQRSTAEIVNGEVAQVTQALDERADEATFLIFGERQTVKLKPINECCAVCDFFHQASFTTHEQCQERQKQDAAARGFHRVICPHQFG